MKLTVTASNRDRLDPDSLLTQWFIKSIQWQAFTDFELLIADGGSHNYDVIKSYLENYSGTIPMRIVQHKIGELFERALLNNVGVRNANAVFIMTTDVDMIFHPHFMEELASYLDHDTLIESRTLYLKQHAVNKIHNGIMNPYTDWDSCKIGRIKKRTTAGGCQCMHIDQWSELRGFDETYVGWGSEDQDLYTRVQMKGLKTVWMGESKKAIRLFHQSHPRDIRTDLASQEINKQRLNRIDRYSVNPEGWGGVND